MAGMNTIIAAVATVLGTVSGIGTIYQYNPYLITPPKFPYAYIWEDGVFEEPHGMPQGINTVGGNKWVHHQTYCEIGGTSTKPQTDEALFRTLLDNVRLAYRDNPTLAGAALRFGLNINVKLSQPEKVGNAVLFLATISCEALEQIAVP